MTRSPLLDISPCDEPATVLAHAPASATCLPVTVCSIPGSAELVDDWHPTPKMLVAHSGSGRRWYKQGSRTLTMQTRPRMIEIYGAGLAFDRCCWEGEAGLCAVVEFTDEHVQALTHGEIKSLKLSTQHEVFDHRLSQLALELSNEALTGLPSGALYAQGLSIAILGLLESGYASGTRASKPEAGQLSARDQRRLMDLVLGELGTDLSIVRMASEVGLSPSHFARAFKATFGVTPHSYVQSNRLQYAVTALREDGARSIADIAIACGFSSQAHMTNLIRQHLGVTPRQIRGQV